MGACWSQRFFFFFSSRRRHTRFKCDWSSDVCSSDLSRWQCWELAHWTPAVSVYLRENMFKKLKNWGDPDPAEIKKGDEKFHPLARVLDEQLADQDYLVGNALTLADISVCAFLMYATHARVPIEPYRNIRRWVSRMNAMPAWEQSLPPMAA